MDFETVKIHQFLRNEPEVTFVTMFDIVILCDVLQDFFISRMITVDVFNNLEGVVEANMAKFTFVRFCLDVIKFLGVNIMGSLLMRSQQTLRHKSVGAVAAGVFEVLISYLYI